MGRFYRTADSQFVNYVFQPNVKLQLGLAQEQAKADYLKSQILQDVPDVEIQHMNINSDNEKVKELQNKYDSSISDLAQKIYADPENSNQYISAISKLQRGMLQDKTEGDWSNIERRAQAYQQWLKDPQNVEARKKDPYIFNAMNAYWRNDLENRLKDNPEADFNAMPVVTKPDFFSKKLMDIYNKIKDSKSEQQIGNYDYTTSGVDPMKAMSLAWDELQQDPQMKAYIQQMGGLLKQPGFYNDKGNFISPFQLVDNQGNPVTKERFEKMGNKERAQVRTTLNPESAFSTDLRAVGEALGHQTTTYKANSFALEKQKYDDAKKIAQFKYNLAHPKSTEIADDSIIFTANNRVVLPSQIDGSINDWFSLENAKTNKRDYNKQELAKLDMMFDPFVLNNGDKIIKAYGDYPEKYKTFADKKKRVLEIMHNINNIDNEKETVGGKYIGSHFVSQHEKYTSKGLRAKSAKEVLDKEWGDYKDYLSKNLVLATKYKTIAKDPTSQKILTDISKNLLANSPNTYLGYKTTHNLDGSRRKSDAIVFDKHWYNLWYSSTKRPIQFLEDKTKMPLKDLVNQGYLMVSYRPTGQGELNVLVKPTPKFEDKFGYDIEKAEMKDTDYPAFSITLSNMDNINKYFNPDTKDPDEYEMYMESTMGRPYISTVQKIEYMEALEQKDPKRYKIYTKGYPMMLPNFSDHVGFSFYKDGKGGVYVKGKNFYKKDLQPVQVHITKEDIAASKLGNVNTALKAYLGAAIFNDSNFLDLRAGKKTKK